MRIPTLNIGRTYGPFLVTYRRDEERDLGVLVSASGHSVGLSIGWPGHGFVVGLAVPGVDLKHRRWHRVLWSAR